MDLPPRRVDLHLPFSTIVRVLGAALAVYCLVKLWPEVVFLLLAVLLAVALEPSVAWAEKHRIPRGVAVMGLVVGLVGGSIAILAVAIPPLVSQLASLATQLPTLRARLEHEVPADSPFAGTLHRLLAASESTDIAPSMSHTLLIGQTTLSGVGTAGFVVIATLYLLLDGKRLYAWLLAYVPRSHRGRVAETVPEVSRVVTAYVRGQLFTSVLFGVLVALLLWACKVPAVLPLAILAALCDVVPVVGIIIAVLPAAFLALTVSPLTAGIVAVSYLVYHQIETYLLVPRIYGSTLRLSTLAVLLALLVGGTLQGMLGIILCLPIVAAYPIVERIWLKDYLAPHVITDHEALAKAAEAGSDEAVEAVLHGEKHADEAPSIAPNPPMLPKAEGR